MQSKNTQPENPSFSPAFYSQLQPQNGQLHSLETTIEDSVQMDPQIQNKPSFPPSFYSQLQPQDGQPHAVRVTLADDGLQHQVTVQAMQQWMQEQGYQILSVAWARQPWPKRLWLIALFIPLFAVSQLLHLPILSVIALFAITILAISVFQFGRTRIATIQYR